MLCMLCMLWVGERRIIAAGCEAPRAKGGWGEEVGGGHHVSSVGHMWHVHHVGVGVLL